MSAGGGSGIFWREGGNEIWMCAEEGLVGMTGKLRAMVFAGILAS